MRYHSQTENKLQSILTEYFNQPHIKDSIHPEHLEDTPERIVDAMGEMFGGLLQRPDLVLSTVFTNTKYDEIIYVNDIGFVSNCAHHNLPFLGKMHFGYLPDKGIVGLSKIPRLMDIFAKRPQVQEKLTQEIVDSFENIVKPLGCGLIIEAWHLCMMIRGVKQSPAYTKTAALRGSFKDNVSTKQEFLDGVKQCSRQIWP